MQIFSLSTRVSYDDIDLNMNLSLKGALRFMQEAAMLHSGLAGYSVGDVDRTHVTWMLVQWRVRLLEKIPWGEKVTVNAWPRSMERATSIRNFELIGPDNKVAAIGESNWVLVNTNTGRITRITPEVASAYKLNERDVFDEPLPEIAAGGGEITWKAIVGRRDIDTNHHVNNRVYLDYAKEALPESLSELPFREVSVRYRKQLLLGDAVQCRYSCHNGAHTVDICGENTSIVHGTVVFFE